jgi:GT2 family glycosyltransferase
VNRPEVSVVMPFAGTQSAAIEAIEALRSLETRTGDELIFVDNTGAFGSAGELEGIELVRATAEPSPAHARNVGAAHARTAWVLFIDADCEPRRDLLNAYFAGTVADDVGALAGEVRSAPGAESVVGRYGAARGFLSQETHLQHRFRPRAAAANLMVRRAAFEAIGGFYEGVRAAEDTDFSWRLQHAGWRLELRSEAFVWHRYRTTLGELRRQWRGYAAGRAWLARRYEGFEPEPGLARAARRARRRTRGAREEPPRRAPPPGSGRVERGTFVALDALLSFEELAGLTLSNRADRRGERAVDAPAVVLVADRFPARGDPLVELARTLERARVEALARPDSLDAELARGLQIDYVEDDGAAARLVATGALLARHPIRSTLDVLRRAPGEPTLRALAPAVRRLERDRDARLQALGTRRGAAVARRLATLTGRSLDR